MPGRATSSLQGLITNNQINSLQTQVSSIQSDLTSTTTTVTALSGVPKQVTGVSATESPDKTQAGMFSIVAVDFTPVPGDPYFSGVQIFFTGYNGSTAPQLMSQGSTSPIEFLCSTTHEVVTVTVVAFSASGISADFATAPTTTVSLDGVTSAPPAPSIAQAQVALTKASGWQFSFNVLGGLEFDLISGYRIYHSTVNTTPVPPANQYQAIPQPSTNIGTIVVQEIVAGIVYYWVSSVSTSGLESSLTPVPFVYIDPASPPPTLTPITTVNSYLPTVYLNGWTNNAHDGNYEGGGGLGSQVWGLNNDTTYPYTNPTTAYDGNEGTAATLYMQHTHEYAGCIWTFSAFPGLDSATVVTGAQLKIMSEAKPSSGFAGHCDIWYSLDGGTTFTSKYVTFGIRSQQYDTVTLSTSQDFTKIQVMAFSDSHDDVQHLVYEIRLELTTEYVNGPDPVNGVVASLVSGNVNIVFNALTPLTRTDIVSYQIFRALHGAGYTTSHLVDTITPTGASTYSWVDTTVHDGSCDYWVLAENPNGYSIPSQASETGINVAANTNAVGSLTVSSGSLTGTNGTAIQSSGNIQLKNIANITGITVNPTVPTSWADMDELGSANPAMTFTTFGNPVFIGGNHTFLATTSGGSVGSVTSIGMSFSATTTHLAPPAVSISIAGDGTGAGASVSWVNTGGSFMTGFVWQPYLTLSGGGGYTFATATITISNGSGSYSNGTTTPSCTVSVATPAAGVAVQVQLLMDGVPILGPIQATTDSTGTASFNLSQPIFPTAGSHSFQFQHQQLGSGTVTVPNRQFHFIELG